MHARHERESYFPSSGLKWEVTSISLGNMTRLGRNKTGHSQGHFSSVHKGQVKKIGNLLNLEGGGLPTQLMSGSSPTQNKCKFLKNIYEGV